MPYPFKFTVFTATYNRAATLHRPYHSLCAQSLRDFEWLVVDDGSTDETRNLIETWQREANFSIRYLYQPNCGKPTACNLGIDEAQGEFFLTLDSDDGCTSNALERFLYHWNNIPLESRSQFSAVTALCQNQHGKLVGGLFPKDVLDSNSIELTYKYKVKGEKWGFQRTDVLKEFRFPVNPEHKFVSESVVWLAIARRYQTRFVNEQLRVYWIDDGAADHLTTLRPEVVNGRAACHRVILNDLIGWLPQAPLELARSAINFSRYSFDQGLGPVRQFSQIDSRIARILLLASLPFGYAISLRDRQHL
ncbi:MAG TPA: glycosyltransferase family 2 protein [Bryobacteraceae bacterium]|jgi:glycosyltransferase involved in cell wall biosynthesis|nr:glycosyltransferase family 2 protein [Bryobacteraceae bacterium]